MPRFTPSQLFDYLFKGRYLNVYSGRLERLQYDPYRNVLNVWLANGSLRQITGVSRDEAAQMVGATAAAGLSGSVDIDNLDLEQNVLTPRGRPVLAPADNDFAELHRGEWLVVISSNVHRIRWERETALLQVQFDWGGTYDYPDIDKGTAEEFLLYYSKGKFVWQRLRGLEKVRIVQSPKGQGGRGKGRAMPQGPGRFDPYEAERRRKRAFMRLKARTGPRGARPVGGEKPNSRATRQDTRSGPLRSLLGKIAKTVKGWLGV